MVPHMFLWISDASWLFFHFLFIVTHTERGTWEVMSPETYWQETRKLPYHGAVVRGGGKGGVRSLDFTAALQTLSNGQTHRRWPGIFNEFEFFFFLLVTSVSVQSVPCVYVCLFVYSSVLFSYETQTMESQTVKTKHCWNVFFKKRFLFSPTEHILFTSWGVTSH